MPSWIRPSGFIASSEGVHEKEGLLSTKEISKNLARYRSKNNNFGLSK